MPDFGKITIGATSLALSANNKRFCKFTAPADLASVLSISAYLNRTGTGSGYGATAGIYTDSSGSPNSLVSNSEILVNSNLTRNSPQWYTVNYVTAPVLTPGAVYWLGVMTNNAILTYHDSGTTNQQASAADTYADGLAASFGTPTFAANEVSFYVTYQAAVTRRVFIIS